MRWTKGNPWKCSIISSRIMQSRGVESDNDLSSFSCWLNTKTYHQIPANIIHLHNLFQHLSLGGPSAHCLMKQCSLILGRAIYGLRAVQKKACWMIKGSFGWGWGCYLCASTCVFITAISPIMLYSIPLNHYTTSSTSSILSILSISIYFCLHLCFSFLPKSFLC